ncbi:MAG: hypothetical protein FWC76_01500 [Defluviitaleaceae bacterium]|nr:hypothetical protein [Defluviitaleaceae bacterium]
MKKKMYILGIGLAFLAGGLIFGGNPLSANPGGTEDPLVTQSYVDMRINQLLQQGVGQQVNTDAIINEILNDITGFFGNEMSFSPVHVNAGQIVLAGEGTEVILRSGTATAHVPGPDGIVNASAGLDLDHGHPISRNHLMIIPREDGRGIRATTDAWFIIRGNFTIVTQ